MYQQDSILNNLQGLIYYETQTNRQQILNIYPFQIWSLYLHWNCYSYIFKFVFIFFKKFIINYRDKVQYVFLRLFLNLCYQAIGLMSRVFANGTGDRGSIPGRFILKTQKMFLDAALFKIQHYKVRIKGKVEQSWEWSSALSYTSVL